MRVLLDQGMNPRVRNALPGHETAHTDHLGWRLIDDHLLLPKAEAEGFAVLITTDKNMQSQQNSARRRISLVVLSDNSNQSIRAAYQRILEAVERSTLGSYEYLEL